MSDRRQRVRRPPARVVRAYFAGAHLALLLALVLLVWQPALATEFYYQPRTIAVVHLITLGWLTGSILGALYAMAPLAWRIEVPGGRADRWAFWIWAISVSGMVTHFWINEYNGMAWAGITALAAIAFVGWRVLPGMARAQIPLEHRVPVLLAFLNLALAGGLGLLLALQKMGLIALPGPPLSGVYAHAHVAALGWVLMMIYGAGYRLLPMFLPAPMPKGFAVWLPPVLLEIAVLALGVGLLWATTGVLIVGAGAAVASALCFVRLVVRMALSRRRSPIALDLTLPVTGAAFAYLLVAAILGSAVLLTEDPVARLRLAAVYGALALMGFLAQVVVGIGGRLLPLTVWMQEFIDAGYKAPIVALHELADRRLQWAVLGGWGTGAPLFCLGIWLGSPGLARGGAAALLAGALADGCNRLVMLRRARRFESALD
ncbi:MAG: hypothetical protein GKS06_07485 [Acidobacteria bacterium]|nr:hypothetical protein [Acidobacteriota bacterium]